MLLPLCFPLFISFILWGRFLFLMINVSKCFVLSDRELPHTVKWMHHTCVQPALSTKNESFKGKYIRTIGKQNHRAEKKRVSTALPELTPQEVTHPPFYWSLSGWSSQLGSILRYPTCLSLTADGTWKKKRPTGNIVFQCKHSKRKKSIRKGSDIFKELWQIATCHHNVSAPLCHLKVLVKIKPVSHSVVMCCVLSGKVLLFLLIG